jgi:HlyD family secretion protein
MAALTLLLSLAALSYFAIPLLLGPTVIGTPVIHADFVQSIVASGHVEASFRVNIGSQITGIVVEVPVSEGQAVKTGDVLIRLDDHEARSAVVAATSAVAEAEARLRQMRELTLPSALEDVKQAQANQINAVASHFRTATLAAKGDATRVALDDATRALLVANALVRNAELQVLTNSPGGSDHVMTEAKLAQAQASLATANSRLGYTVITAPRDGVLILREVERGNVVQPSNVLMKLSPAGDTQLIVQIDEKNLGLIALGQKAMASADAFPKQTFAADLSYINPGVDLQRASVEVKLQVPAPPPYLRQDMTVSVDIEVARRPSALIVPAADVRDIGSDSPWVMKLQTGHAVRQPVKVGLVSAGKAEILEGLSPGDIVLPGATGIKDGARVRASTAVR